MAKERSIIERSKQLSWLLRHGAQKEGLTIQPDGFVCVNDILKHSRYASQFTKEKLHEIVTTDSKQRYTLRSNPLTGAEEIRANQGHSIPSVESESCMERINSISELPFAVAHGTYYRNWRSIKTQGLKRMKRNHVHFALLNHEDNRKVVSGFRSDCQVLIYLNVAKVLADQMPLFRSSNDVILCAGNDGCIDKQYFERVIDRGSGKSLSF